MGPLVNSALDLMEEVDANVRTRLQVTQQLTTKALHAITVYLQLSFLSWPRFRPLFLPLFSVILFYILFSFSLTPALPCTTPAGSRSLFCFKPHQWCFQLFLVFFIFREGGRFVSTTEELLVSWILKTTRQKKNH